MVPLFSLILLLYLFVCFAVLCFALLLSNDMTGFRVYGAPITDRKSALHVFLKIVTSIFQFYPFSRHIFFNFPFYLQKGKWEQLLLETKQF